MAENKSERGNDFRVVAADSFSMRLNDNMAQVTFGMEVGPGGDGPTQILENTMVALTPRSLKVLGMIINHAISSFEAANGVIPLPPKKAEELAAALKIHVKASPKKPASNA